MSFRVIKLLVCFPSHCFPFYVQFKVCEFVVTAMDTTKKSVKILIIDRRSTHDTMHHTIGISSFSSKVFHVPPYLYFIIRMRKLENDANKMHSVQKYH